jgi:hypothetical protein
MKDLYATLPKEIDEWTLGYSLETILMKAERSKITLKAGFLTALAGLRRRLGLRSRWLCAGA